MNEIPAVRVFDRLLEISLLIQHDMAAGFAGTELNTARTHLLWELHRIGPSTQQALATALGVTPANVTGLVDALETHGFVERRRHPTDRRATLVTLTERGDETIRGMERDREQFATALVDGLDDDRLERFRGTLDAVAERLAEITRPKRESEVTR
ncbi:MAG: MarR family winged helix-turn-helix transcriptional regulator [Stackebrandtia sp.]